MNNSFNVYSTNDGMKEFLKSSIDTSKSVIEHYDFVIKDISSNISDSKLEATKGPTLEFLHNMRKHWIDFKNDLEVKLKNLE